MEDKLYFQYWGKARKEGETGPEFHLLPYHCLDVAAVADEWWRQSSEIRRCFMGVTGLNELQTRAWLLFFVALHDYGKFDLRFQSKAPKALASVNPELKRKASTLTPASIKKYNHGPAGLFWFYQDLKQRFSAGEQEFYFDDNQEWQAWYSWLAPVVGHHGIVPEEHKKDSDDYGLTHLQTELKNARMQWLSVLEKLFLTTGGLSLKDNPPEIPTTKNKQTAAVMLAGFCSVSDWLGSSDSFYYDDEPCMDLNFWYQKRLEIAKNTLQVSGVISQIKPFQGVDTLLNGYSARQVQCLIDELPTAQGLTLIESSTGSGKTEAALAYAWKLLANGLAESIVFALPTQATANAMLKRLEKIASLVFANETNVVLAHGRARFQEDFIDLKQACRPHTVQDGEEAWVQCGNWLAQSRKRIFLGQIGICTVDQVLVSVLPVKHKFVRGFGLGRSVLIVDEVHAYDSYMYGLLEAVLEQQYLSGGCAILLSATLPFQQKALLAKTWNSQLSAPSKIYPLITHIGSGQPITLDLTEKPKFQPKVFSVQVQLLKTVNLLPDENLIQRLLDAVLQGAQVCLVCNLVTVAQQTYQQMSEHMEQDGRFSENQCLLFHSRFVFADRQIKEKLVLNLFGPDPEPADARCKGHLLIATQVVEQSLDLDFDWLITQLCPVDLLFQRMGRLHRHPRTRPANFNAPVCTVLLPTEVKYDLHELIYGNSQVLWRTQQLLENAVLKDESMVIFPAVYREWIEPVYSEEVWQNEPESVVKSFELYKDDCFTNKMKALQLIKSNMNELADNDINVLVLTRDGEMGLNLIPFYSDSKGEKCLLSGELLEKLDESMRLEALSQNTVSVPTSWRNHGRLPESDAEGLIWLYMQKKSDGYLCIHQENCQYLYSTCIGLARNIEQEI